MRSQSPALEELLRIYESEVPNRLYPAPLFEYASNGSDVVEPLIWELEMAAASDVELVW